MRIEHSPDGQPSNKRVLVLVPPRPQPRRTHHQSLLRTLIVDILDLGVQSLDWLKHKVLATADPRPDAEVVDISPLAEIRERELQKVLEDKLHAIERWSEHYFEPESEPEKPLPQAPFLREVLVRHLTAAAEVMTLTDSQIRWTCAWILTHLMAEFEDMTSEVDERGRDVALGYIGQVESEPLYTALKKLFRTNMRMEPEEKRRYELRYTHFMVTFTREAASRGIKPDTTDFKILEDLMALVWLTRCLRGDRMKPHKYAYAKAEAEEDNEIGPAPVPRAGPGRGHLRLLPKS